MAGIGDLCGTGIYANEVACEIDGYISDFVDKAVASEAALNTALADLTNAYDQNTATPDYSPDTSGVDKTFINPVTAPARGNYAGLQPAEVVLPARGPLLTSAQSDDIFARARSAITRTHAANIRSALEQTGTMGLGLPSPAILRRVAEANQKSAEAVSAVALEQAAQEGVWGREDIKVILDLEVRNFTEKWGVIRTRLAAEEETFRSEIENYKAELAKEAERRGWSQLQIEDILKQAETEANVAIQWGRITLDKLMQVEEVIVRMKAAVFQAWLQAADLNLSFQGSQSVTDNSP